MSRLLFVAVALGAVLFPVTALAYVPGPNCSITWHNVIIREDHTMIGRVSPSGDYSTCSYIDVIMRDLFNLPIPGWVVQATFSDSRICALSISGITDSQGYCRLRIQSGLNTSASTTRVTTDYSVTCRGVTLLSSTMQLVSPDYNCNPTVDALDFAFFAMDWLTSGQDLRSDFNDDGAVDALDFAIFAIYWGDHF